MNQEKFYFAFCQCSKCGKLFQGKSVVTDEEMMCPECRKAFYDRMYADDRTVPDKYRLDNENT